MTYAQAVITSFECAASVILRIRLEEDQSFVIRRR